MSVLFVLKHFVLSHDAVSSFRFQDRTHFRADCGAVSQFGRFRSSPILFFDLAPRPALVTIKSLDQPLSHAAILAVAAVVPVEVGTRDSAFVGTRDSAIVGTRDSAIVGTRDSARDGIQVLSTAL